MPSKSEILSRNYFDATETIRHYDALRATFSGLALTSLSILTGLDAFKNAQMGGSLSKPVACIAALISALSVIVLLKLHSLIITQRRRAAASLKLLEADESLKALSDVDASVASAMKQSLLYKVSLNATWTSIFLVFFAVSLWIIFS